MCLLFKPTIFSHLPNPFSFLRGAGLVSFFNYVLKNSFSQMSLFVFSGYTFVWYFLYFTFILIFCYFACFSSQYVNDSSSNDLLTWGLPSVVELPSSFQCSVLWPSVGDALEARSQQTSRGPGRIFFSQLSNSLG